MNEQIGNIVIIKKQYVEVHCVVVCLMKTILQTNKFPRTIRIEVIPFECKLTLLFLIGWKVEEIFGWCICAVSKINVNNFYSSQANQKTNVQFANQPDKN